jgi:HK97 gp10 family phage protein
MADVHWQSDALDKLLNEEAMALVDADIVPEVVKDMKRMAPVDTGAMRDSIEGQPGGRITISAVSPQGHSYPADVEFGTENMPAQPFVRPALYRKRG